MLPPREFTVNYADYLLLCELKRIVEDGRDAEVRRLKDGTLALYSLSKKTVYKSSEER